jgi:colanic acid biosynthesis glycosyl transferase WcaI
MKLLVVTQYFRPEGFPINDVVDRIADLGHRVTVLTGMPNYPSGRFATGYGGWFPIVEHRGGTRIVRVPIVARGTTRTGLALNYLTFTVSASIVGPALVNERFDAILVYAPSPITSAIPGIVLKRLYGGFLSLWVQDLWPESLTAGGGVTAGPVIAAVRHLVRWIYSRCDAALVPSRAFRAPVEAHGMPGDRIRYVPNTVEATYRPLTVPPDCPLRSLLPASGFRIMYGGNIGAAQDFDTVLAAAAATRHRRDIHWVLVGDGRARGQVEAEVKRQDLSATVHLTGPRPPADMPVLFALADALLLTLRREPAFAVTVPSKLQAYLACGRPILAGIDGEAARIVVEADAGLAVPAGDPAALAAAAITMADAPPGVREAWGRNGAGYFEREFGRATTLERLLDGLSGSREPGRT